MENMDKGLTVPKWVLKDSSAKNTPNAPEFIYTICLPNPKSSGFQLGRLLGRLRAARGPPEGPLRAT